jgi:hypothetical protein
MIPSVGIITAGTYQLRVWVYSRNRYLDGVLDVITQEQGYAHSAGSKRGSLITTRRSTRRSSGSM